MNFGPQLPLPTIGSPGPRIGGSRCFVNSAAIAPATAFAESSCAPIKPDQLVREPVNVE